LAIVLSVLRYTDSDCPFGIFKLFLIVALGFLTLQDKYNHKLSKESRNKQHRSNHF
jgi:hypothetical protein